MDSQQLRRVIRERITAGRLPGTPANLVSTGWGTGRRCAACDEVITATDTEIEIEVAGGHPTIRFHQPCFALWRMECDH